MSRIIKAADLKVLIPNESQTVIPAPTLEKDENKSTDNNTLLKSASLVQDAQRKATEILQEAEKQAKSIVQSAEEELEVVRLHAKEKGFEEGYREGITAGKEVAMQEAKNLLTLLESTIEEAINLRATGLESLEDDFIKLSLILADKIVKKQVNSDISWLEPIIRDALGALGSVDKIIVKVNPEDFELINENSSELELNSRVKIEFDVDSSICQGGCLIESEKGLIDARLEKRLGKLGAHLMEVLYDEKD